MPPVVKPMNPDAVLSCMVDLRTELEEALCHVVKLEEMAKEVDTEEWGQEVWDENAAWELQELRGDLTRLKRFL